MSELTRPQAQRATISDVRAGQSGLLQRKCSCGQHTIAGNGCSECDKRNLQRVTRNREPGARGSGTVPSIVNEVLRSPGQPLDASTRALFEPRFGHDFSGVRVHTDPRAADSARAVNALAYTIGRDVVFGANQYAPGSKAGQRLLAHELTHTIQQSGVTSIQRLTIGDSGSDAEREADDVTARLIPSSTPPPAVNTVGPVAWRDAQPKLRRWKISGNTATSDKDSDTLGGLAKEAGAHFNDWKCIKPITQRTSTFAKPPGNFNSRYELYVQKGDTFDISNLTATTGESLSIYLFNDASEAMDADLAKKFYPGSSSSSDPDAQFANTSSDGSKPISSLVIFGHAAGNRMWGATASFEPRDFNPEKDAPTFNLASTGLFPRRCWFTRNATARSVGCNSDVWGQDFAGHYLREGASVTTTTAAVRPKCKTATTTGGCTAYDGVDFADSSLTTGTSLEGPFWSVGDFHAGSHWATIKGKL